jgi:hypothetical protein
VEGSGHGLVGGGTDDRPESLGLDLNPGPPDYRARVQPLGSVVTAQHTDMHVQH